MRGIFLRTISSLSFLLCALLLCGCGSSNIANPPIVQAAAPPPPPPSPTPVPTASPTPTPLPFPPSQPLLCSGNTDAGLSCDESDGMHYYRHDQFTVVSRADGHGTFEIIEELGIQQQTGLKQIQFAFPQEVDVQEVHGILQINSWCDGNGTLTKWEGYSANNELSEVIGGKDYNFKAGESVSFVIPQVLFPTPLPLTALQMDTFTDLCASSTIHWMLYGSFIKHQALAAP